MKTLENFQIEEIKEEISRLKNDLKEIRRSLLAKYDSVIHIITKMQKEIHIVQKDPNSNKIFTKKIVKFPLEK